MRVQIAARHFQVSPALRLWAHERIEQLHRKLPGVEMVEVTLWIGRFWHMARVVVRHGSSVFHGEGKSKTMYTSIDHALDKVKRQAQASHHRAYDHGEKRHAVY